MQTLDATNQSLGRLATKIAVLLRGKTDPKYQPNLLPTMRVTVTNISKIKITGKKLDQKTYYHYSGFPGGMKKKNLGIMMNKNPGWVLRTAVYKMLAKNRLRDKIIKNLIITT